MINNNIQNIDDLNENCLAYDKFNNWYRSVRKLKKGQNIEYYLNLAIDNNYDDNITDPNSCYDPITNTYGCGGGTLDLDLTLNQHYNQTYDPCQSNPCQNNAICQRIILTNDFECICYIEEEEEEIVAGPNNNQLSSSSNPNTNPQAEYVGRLCDTPNPCYEFNPCADNLYCIYDANSTLKYKCSNEINLLIDEESTIQQNRLSNYYQYQPFATFLFTLVQTYDDVLKVMANDCHLIYNNTNCPHINDVNDANYLTTNQELNTLKQSIVIQNVTFEVVCDYGQVNNVWSTGDICKTCPLGAICDKEGKFLPVNAYGYHQSETKPFIFLPCQPIEACPAYTNTCANGYLQSTKCSSCAANYFEYDNKCESCEQYASAGNNTMLIIAIIAAIGGISLLVLLATKGAFVFEIATVAATYFQTLYILSTINITWPKQAYNIFNQIGIFNFNVDIMAIECQFLSYTLLLKNF